MEEIVKRDISDILKQAIRAIKESDVRTLRDLSNHTIHDSSIIQDKYSISIAVIMYSLSKIFERTSYQEYKDWRIFYDNLLKCLKDAKDFLESDKIDKYEECTKNILKIINKLESKLKIFIKEVFEKSKINKGSRLYEHGLSISKAAELLNISQWELMDYAGSTGISDVKFSISKSIKERLKYARELFE